MPVVSKEKVCFENDDGRYLIAINMDLLVNEMKTDLIVCN